MFNQKQLELLEKWCKYIRSDDACTDDFLFEGMTFEETIWLMDAVGAIVENFIKNQK